ncbi:MAG: putative quinol monooxygenase [Planctomycetota bacterium]
MIYVIATIELNDGKSDDFIEHFKALVPSVHAEDGCIEYGPTVDLETSIGAQIDCRANVVTIVEKWESLESLEAHLAAPHMLAYRSKVKELVKHTSLQVLEPA